MKVNKEIRASRLRVITEDGEQLGIMGFWDAFNKAQEMGLDLVEIAPNANPPVAKIIDYGKLRYEIQKKEKESKKSQVVIKVKEIKLKPNIDTHDFQTKVKHAREFIMKGNKVRISIMFRGREMLHLDLGQKVVREFCDELSDIAVVETPPKLMGRTMTTVLNPSGKRPKQTTNIGETHSA